MNFETSQALHDLIKEIAKNKQTKTNPEMIRALSELVNALK